MHNNFSFVVNTCRFRGETVNIASQIQTQTGPKNIEMYMYTFYARWETKIKTETQETSRF